MATIGVSSIASEEAFGGVEVTTEATLTVSAIPSQEYVSNVLVTPFIETIADKRKSISVKSSTYSTTALDLQRKSVKIKT